MARLRKNVQLNAPISSAWCQFKRAIQRLSFFLRWSFRFSPRFLFFLSFILSSFFFCFRIFLQQPIQSFFTVGPAWYMQIPSNFIANFSHAKMKKRKTVLRRYAIPTHFGLPTCSATALENHLSFDRPFLITRQADTALVMHIKLRLCKICDVEWMCFVLLIFVGNYLRAGPGRTVNWLLDISECFQAIVSSYSKTVPFQLFNMYMRPLQMWGGHFPDTKSFYKTKSMRNKCIHFRVFWLHFWPPLVAI